MLNNKKNKRINVWLVLFAVLANILFASQNTLAYNSFFSNNDILFYSENDSCAESVSTVSSVTTAWTAESRSNMDIIANYLTTNNFVGNGNQPLNSVQLAALMGNLGRESTFNPESGVTVNPGSYKGLVSWGAGRWANIADPKTDIYNQLNHIKKELDGDYRTNVGRFWEIASVSNLDEATFLIHRNYEVAILSSSNPGPREWTNDTDATNNLQHWDRSKRFAHEMYNLYGTLAESGTIPADDCGSGLVSGGMTLAQANDFMDIYKNLQPSDWPDRTYQSFDLDGKRFSLLDAGGRCLVALANCVAFSQYFILRYTDFPNETITTGDGHSVARSLVASYGFGEEVGSVPRPYAVFSKGDGSTDGHTGVILGVDEGRGKVIIGQASCGDPLSSAGARERNLSDFSSGEYRYAYTDGRLIGEVQ